jgi:hypothetical protein
MACADVAIVKAKAATAINLIIGFSHAPARWTIMRCLDRRTLTQINRGASGPRRVAS